MKKITIALMIIAVVFGLVALAYAQGCCPSEGGGGSSSGDSSSSTGLIKARCPVMGCLIADVDFAPAQSEYNGKTYYFCCDECKTKFDGNPEKYLHKKAKIAKTPAKHHKK